MTGSFPYVMPSRSETLLLRASPLSRYLSSYPQERFSSLAGSGLHFQPDFQFDLRIEWKTLDTKDEPAPPLRVTRASNHCVLDVDYHIFFRARAAN